MWQPSPKSPSAGFLASSFSHRNWFSCECEHVCMCTCICLCVRDNTYTQAHTCTHIDIDTLSQPLTQSRFIHAWLHEYIIYTSMYSLAHTCIHSQQPIHMQGVYAHHHMTVTGTQTHTFISTCVPVYGVYVCVCTCMSSHLRAYVSLCIICAPVCAECECREGWNVALACLAPYCQESTPAPTCPKQWPSASAL